MNPYTRGNAPPVGFGKRRSTSYPDVKWNSSIGNSSIVDASNADVYMSPDRYDVVVMTNLFGDIISNLCTALTGGFGLGGGVIDAALIVLILDHAA
jgi:isocitrate/isopropylmalate dehydrogenase